MEQNVKHILKLIAWHEGDWNGKRCPEPKKNVHCQLGAGEMKTIWESCKKYPHKEPGCWEKGVFEDKSWWIYDDKWNLSIHSDIVNGKSLVFLISHRKEGYFIIGVYKVGKIKGKDLYASIEKSLKLGKQYKIGPYSKQTELLDVKKVKKFGQGKTFAYIDNNKAKILMSNLLMELRKKYEKNEVPKEVLEKGEKIYNDTFENDNNRKATERTKEILNAIETKPFIILSGISGTGKTQIARIISAGISKGTKDGNK